MRSKTYYYGSGTFSEQSRQLNFVARELVEQVFENGYIITGDAYDLPTCVLVLDVLRWKKLVPQDLWFMWKEEIIGEKLRVAKFEKAGQCICYHFGLSAEFGHSNLYWHWPKYVYPQFEIENIYAEPLETKQNEPMPYLLMKRSGKAAMFEYFKKERNIAFSNILPDEKEVFALLSDEEKFEGHPYLPENPSFDMGIWGYPGIGTKQSVQALLQNGRIENFINLVEVTRVALSFGATEDGDCVRRQVSATGTFLEALTAYYMAWCYLHDTQGWKEAYRRAYLNPIYLEEWKSESLDGDLLVDKAAKKHWENVLMIQEPVQSKSDYDYYKNYLTAFPMDIDTVIGFISEIWLKEGTLAIEGYGKLVLQGIYLDFWNWLYEEKEYQQDEMLAQIACYTENEEVRQNKQKLLEAVKKYDEYAASNLVMPISFHSNKPESDYAQRRRIVLGKLEIERNAYFRELKKYSHSFTKFSIQTESGTMFKQSGKKECERYLRDINTYDLCRAFILYYPSQRDWIMNALSVRLRNILLEDMKWFAKGECFSLSECVEAEQKIAQIIRTIKEKTA